MADPNDMNDMNDPNDLDDPGDLDQVSMAIRAVYDAEEEAVGVDAMASEAFDQGEDIRAKIEILAAITAQANCIAGEIIRGWDAEEDRKKALFDHYAWLKEHMLNDMIERLDDEGADGGAVNS